MAGECALQKNADAGLVTQDKDVCIACGTCVESCPYGVPTRIEGDLVRKCEGCFDIARQGEEPPCVAICPMRALKMGTREEPEVFIAGRNATSDVADLPDSSLTAPSFPVTSKGAMR